MSKIARKTREWVARYMPAEVLGTCTAMGAALIGYHVSGSLAVGAVAGTAGENIGYYGYFAVRETLRHYPLHRHHPPLRRALLTGTKAARDMLIEFGPAEVFDSLLVRPFFMYAIPQLLGHFAAGILIGKLCADVIFYGFAITGYEIKKRWLNLPQDQPDSDA